MDAFVFVFLLFSALLATEVHSQSFQREKRLIVGGKMLYITEAPYQAFIERFDGYYCGGSIIGPRWIITAAHCLKDCNEGTVRVGSNWRDYGGEVRNMARLIMHPDYETQNSTNDIGLIMLDKPLSLKGTKAMCIHLPDEGKIPEEGSIGRVAGWGLRYPNAAQGSPLLLATYLNVLPMEQCQKAYQDRALNAITQFCAGIDEGGRGSCQGDSGGPFVVDNTLYGLVSYGTSCAEIEYPTMYTNVGAYVNWVYDTVESVSSIDDLQCKQYV